MHLSENAENKSAPWFNVPCVPVVGVEHPYMISDIGRCIDTLGGPLRASKLVGEASSSIETPLYFHPGNPNTTAVTSFNTKSNNILLKITVPKGTGRKRKRGSDDPWQQASQVPILSQSLLSDPDNTRHLVRGMRDHPTRYGIEPVGSIAHTHRFRHPMLKNFRFDMSKGIQRENDIIPPPSWTRQTIPFNYSYRHNPSLKQSYTADGAPTSSKPKAIRRNQIFVITHNAPSVPTEPFSELPPESTLAPPLRALLDAMREIFARRPIGTRRSVQNQVPPGVWRAVGPHAAKHLWQYVGFLWNSGPWRDAICAFGVDPRKDREMRWYQTVVFQFEPESIDARANPHKVTRTKMDRDLAAKGENAKGHLFDGQSVRLDGKVWQMCDISDPLVKSMLDTAPLRDECDTLSDGWYPNGTWAKVKVIMKAKITSILSSDTDDSQLENELLRLHHKIPDILNEHNRSEAIFDKGSVPNRMIKLAESVRTTATKPGGKAVAWGPITAKKKPDGTGESPTKKSVAPGRGRGRGLRGGRPRKQARGGRPMQAERQDEPIDGQEMIDPRLRDVTGDMEDVSREVAMRAFEDDAEGSVDEGSDDEGSSDDSSDVDGSDDESSDTDDSEDEASDTDDSEAAEESEMEEDEGTNTSD